MLIILYFFRHTIKFEGKIEKQRSMWAVKYFPLAVKKNI